ncbi:hypothetical protein [Halegenticoccus tardaugens]|uniref:hypothetical protein n=1 Tax=Halegenticoccus tardaugens TaxID=2071624 RepID=UPI00100B5205|nr:hypothetical protein [Halegenticoccus tardaugens]
MTPISRIAQPSHVTRRTFLSLLGAAGLTLRSTIPVHAQTSAVPTVPAYYRVLLEGTTTHEQFSREALLLVSPPLPKQDSFDNGVNAREIAIQSGNPPGTPEGGAIWFATNTSLYDEVGIPSTIDESFIDVAFVQEDPAQSGLGITVDGQVWGLPAARSTVLNVFNSRTGLTAGVYQIIQGDIVLQFADAGNTVVGAINLIGNGFIEPGTYQYTSNLSGSIFQTG